MLIIALKESEETAMQVSALIMAGATVIAYIVGEGLIDAAGVKVTYYELPEPDEKPPAEEE